MFEKQELQLLLPDLDLANFEITSQSTIDYNCIAWAAGENHRWWWPDKGDNYYWPPGVPRVRTLPAFVQAFRTLGYEECSSNDLEPGVEKVAIFVGATDMPTHASRQLPDGNWTSKLGPYQDIRHVLAQVGGYRGKGYGNVRAILKRPRKGP